MNEEQFKKLYELIRLNKRNLDGIKAILFIMLLGMLLGGCFIVML
jgi:hypothetical protein